MTPAELRDLPIGTRITPPDGDNVQSLYKGEDGYWVSLLGQSYASEETPTEEGVPADYVVAWQPDHDARMRSDAHAMGVYGVMEVSVAYLDLVAVMLGPDWWRAGMLAPMFSVDALGVYAAICVRAREHAATARPSDRERIFRMYVPMVAWLIGGWSASVRTERAWMP